MILKWPSMINRSLILYWPVYNIDQYICNILNMTSKSIQVWSNLFFSNWTGLSRFSENKCKRIHSWINYHAWKWRLCSVKLLSESYMDGPNWSLWHMSYMTYPNWSYVTYVIYDISELVIYDIKKKLFCP